jgi:rRNA maturation endonuclease Nob1
MNIHLFLFLQTLDELFFCGIISSKRGVKGLEKFCNACEKEFKAHPDTYQCPSCGSYDIDDEEVENKFRKKRNFDDEKDN